MQTAIADGTEHAFHRALRPARIVPASVVAGLVTMIALAGVGVTSARADEPRNPPHASEPPHPTPTDGRDLFHPEKHVGRLDPDVIKHLREMDLKNKADGFGGRLHPRTATPPPPPPTALAETRGPSAATAMNAELRRWDPLNGDL